MIQVFSLLGASTLLAAYFLIQNGRINAQTWSYILLNLAGAFCLGVVSVYYSIWGNIALDLTWIGIGLTAAYRKLVSERE